MLKAIKVGGRKNPTTIVIAHFEGEALPSAAAHHDPNEDAAYAAQRPEATGETGSIAEAFPPDENPAPRIVLLGLGKRDAFDHLRCFDAAASLGKHLDRIKDDTTHLVITPAIDDAGADHALCGRAFGEALGLLTFDRDEFKGSATDKPKRHTLNIRCDDKPFADALAYGLAIADSVNYARLVSETPPNLCTPDFIAKESRKLARQTGMKCTVVPASKLLEEGLVGHHTVGQASENQPCFVRLEYTPEKPRKNSKPAVLVGKTITYDSGGLSIKGPANMRGMKRDMDGGANVLGAMHAIAHTVKPRRPVVAYLCTAENAISDEAYRPDDILTFANGVTVEITNTDAEGRLVLADGLARACAKENPEFVVDMATLTGGVVVALGSTYAGMWCDDDKLRAAVENAADTTGERVWRLPNHDEYRELMRSPVADILNSAPVRAAHPIQAAAFLSYFVDESTPWCHLDIAGVHSVDSEKGPYAKQSATGFGVRLLAELADSA